MEMETFLTPEELSELLRVSRVWIYKLCDQGRIPFFRVAGKVIRFQRTQIEQWLQESRGGKYRRDKAKSDSEGKGLSRADASREGKNNRAPAPPSGEPK